MIGMISIALVVLALKFRKRPGQPVLLPLILLPLVIMQGLLGMWTVTLKLFPPVVMGHLVGGFSVAAIFFWLSLPRSSPVPSEPRLKALGLAAGAALILQIFLGGWISANYAALACPDFPTCQTEWWPELADFGAGFDLAQPVGPDYDVPSNSVVFRAIVSAKLSPLWEMIALSTTPSGPTIRIVGVVVTP